MLHQVLKIGIFELLLRLVAIVLATFAEAKNLFNAVIFLIIVDQVTGVIKAFMNKDFKWGVFNKVYRKVIVYMIVIMATFVFEKYLIETGSIFFTKSISALIGFQELASTYINVTKITGINFFENIISKFKINEK